jgi:hypothetical protein
VTDAKSSQRGDRKDQRFSCITSFFSFLCFLFFISFLILFDSSFNSLLLLSCLSFSSFSPHILPFSSSSLLQVSVLHSLLSRFLFLFSLLPPSSYLFPSIDCPHLTYVFSLLRLLSHFLFILFFLPLILLFILLSPSHFLLPFSY